MNKVQDLWPMDILELWKAWSVLVITGPGLTNILTAMAQLGRLYSNVGYFVC